MSWDQMLQALCCHFLTDGRTRIRNNEDSSTFWWWGCVSQPAGTEPREARVEASGSAFCHRKVESLSLENKSCVMILVNSCCSFASHPSSCGMMGWMWALLIHPSSCTALIDAFPFRKSLHWQQEGDRGGQNPRTQHVHEGNRPAGSTGYLLQRRTDSSGLNDAVGG